MTCCSEQTASLAKKSPGASQHVNYAKGMVLGVDDFTQEFAYLSGRAEWMARDLIGYGTSAGLVVAIEDGGAQGPRIRVTSGSAVSPRGTMICVPVDQCASINAWLATPKGMEASKGITGSPGAIALYLTLCYADCETNRVPIPGEPCRSDDELMKPSRIADDFKLEIGIRPPGQKEEDALRNFVEWLRAIQAQDESPSAPASTEKELLDALRAAAEPWLHPPRSSPPVSPPSNEVPDLVLGSPPASLRIHPDDRCELLRAAFRFWVTELRPAWLAVCCGCAGAGTATEDCVLLAKLDVPLIATSSSPGSVWQAAGDAKSVVVNESRRPFLVHQRLLQEWLLCGSCCAPGSGAGPGPIVSPPVAVPAAEKKILGTARQVIVTPTAPNEITLSAPQDIAPASKPTFDGLTTTASVEIKVSIFNTDAVLDDTMHCVILRPPTPPRRVSPPQLKASLPTCVGRIGRVYIIKSPNTSIEVVPNGAEMIDEKAGSSIIATGRSATLVSDGKSGWFVIGTS